MMTAVTLSGEKETERGVIIDVLAAIDVLRNADGPERLLRAVMRMEKPPGTEPGQWMALLSRVITGPTGVRGGAMVKAVMEHATRGVRP